MAEGTPYASLRERLNALGTPEQKQAPQRKQAARQPGWRERIKGALFARDPEIEYTGVPHFGLRAGLSRMDTPEERERYLTEQVGQEGWTQTRYGQYALTPGGMEQLGVLSGRTPPGMERAHTLFGDRPVTIEEPGITRYDVADIAGSAPSILGGMAGATLGGPLGFLGGAALAGLGAAGGKGYGEAVEALRGENIQSPGQVAADIGTEAALGAAGEGVYRGVLAPIGRKLMAPQASRVTPEARELQRQARELGAQANVQQVTKAPILGRTQSMMNRILGDPLQEQNQKALNAELQSLKQAAGPRAKGQMALGEQIKADIQRSRQALARWSNSLYGEIETMTGGNPVVNTRLLKARAQEIRDALPRREITETVPGEVSPIVGATGQPIETAAPKTLTRQGAPVLTSAEARLELDGISQLPEQVTIGQMQRMSQRLWDMIDNNTLVPGISSRDARLMWKASRKSLLDIVETAPKETRGLLQAANTQYANQIKQFDDALINRIVRDPKYAGAIEPERVVGAVFRKGEGAKVNRVMRLLPEGTKANIRRSAMEDILRSAIGRTDDPLVDIFTGKNFMNTLDGYGRETLNAMFGRDLTNRLYRFGGVTQFISQKSAQAGGLVAAGIALHPWRNMGRLIGLGIMSKVMNSPAGLKWLTEGIEAPNTRKGMAAITRLGTQIQALSEEHTRETSPGVLSRVAEEIKLPDWLKLRRETVEEQKPAPAMQSEPVTVGPGQQAPDRATAMRLRTLMMPKETVEVQETGEKVEIQETVAAALDRVDTKLKLLYELMET